MAIRMQCRPVLHRRVNCKVPIWWRGECKVLVRLPHIMLHQTRGRFLTVPIRFTRLTKQMTCKWLRVVPCKLGMASMVWA